MRKNLTLLVLCFVTYYVSSAEWTGIRSSSPSPARTTLLSSNTESSVIRFSLDGFLTAAVITPQGPAVVIGLEEATPVMIQGAPDLPKITASVIIPDLALMRIDLLEANYRDFGNIFVAPSKGNLTRDIDPSSVPYQFGAPYQVDDFFPGDLAGLREPYIVRDYRGQTVIAYPFQYNPVTRTLRVYTDITVRISRESDAGLNPMIRTSPLEKIDADFSPLYQSHFLNPVSNGSRYTPIEEYGNILIISYGAFIPELQAYVDWKEQVGYPVEVVDVGTIGNSSAIKSFIANYYNTKGVTFVLLVGDGAQVPTSSTSAGPSDNNYAYVVGDDHYPDLFIGRFSAENIAQVQTQVQRTLMYEQNPPTSADWFTKCTGVASNQGPGDEGEMDYQHIRNIQDNKLIPFTYTYANELYDGSQGGNDASGNPSPSQVADAVNAGTTIINYTGHGSVTSWGTSGFSNSNVNSLTNDNMLPFVWSVACVNGDFANNTCFAEAWLRATHNDQPTGAVAFLGSTINQSWNPPMCGQDEMNDVLTEAYNDNIKRTFGALSMHGCMKMNDEYGGGGSDMTDTWLCFGDASLMVRTAVPQTMTATYDPVLFLGMEEMQINCSANGARATLSHDGSILATGIVQNGSVTLEFYALSNPTTITLTITAFNYIPHVASIDVIPAEGPFVVMKSFDINDISGNDNGLADYNEAIYLTIELENLGIEDAADVAVLLSASDPYIEITDAEELYPLIPAAGTTSVANAFALTISSDIPDQHTVIFSLNSSNGDQSWQSSFGMNVNAPILHINSLTVDDAAQGNNDGELDPGETAELTINYSNSGHAVAFNVAVQLEGQSGFVECPDAAQNFQSIGFFGVFEKTFTVTVDEETPEGIDVNFVNELTMNSLSLSRVFPLKISAKCEDFETGDLTRFNWQQSGDQPWHVIGEYPQEGLYCLKSGNIAHNQSSEIYITYEVMHDDSIVFMRKVSSESSDFLKFFINGQLKEDWSGNGAGWKREAFAVEAGTNTFKWVYQKNGLGSAGSDCAWLDYIILPVPLVLTIWAGPDDAICAGESYQLNESFGTFFTQIEWTSSGSGTFDDNTIMHPVYNPSGYDQTGGEVTLSLTLRDEEGNSVTDGMLLTLADMPAMPPTPEGPDYVDVAVTTISEYAILPSGDADFYIWHLEPADAGTLSGSDETVKVTWNGNYTGQAFISVTAVNGCGESPVSSALEITVDNSLVNITEPSQQDLVVRVYPNPASDVVNLRVTGTVSGSFTVSLYNLLGSLVFRSDWVSEGSDIVTLDVSELPEGMYILSLEGENIRHAHKFIIR